MKFSILASLLLSFSALAATKTPKASPLWKALSVQEFNGVTAKGERCQLLVEEHRPALPLFDQIKWSDSFVMQLRIEDLRGQTILSELTLGVDPTLDVGKSVEVLKKGLTTEYTYTKRYHATTVGSMGSVIATRVMVFEIDNAEPRSIRSFKYKLTNANSNIAHTSYKTMHDYSCTLD